MTRRSELTLWATQIVYQAYSGAVMGRWEVEQHVMTAATPTEWTRRKQAGQHRRLARWYPTWAARRRMKRSTLSLVKRPLRRSPGEAGPIRDSLSWLNSVST